MFYKVRMLMFLLLGLLVACGGLEGEVAETTVPPTTAATTTAKADLEAIKSYLLAQATELNTSTAELQTAANTYYELAQAANFDYAALWQNQREATVQALEAAKTAWMAASPGYEEIEGIVAGVPSLAEYDVILDAGASAEEDPENAAPYDLSLPDGRVLSRPGNLFGLLEGTLWGTRVEFTATGVEADLDGDGTVEFGEALPEANMLKGSADTMHTYTTQLLADAQTWQPTESDAFTALAVMIPTMSEYFESWKNSRFVAGEASTQSDFAVISRLADIEDILAGLQVVHAGVSPLIVTVDPAQNTQIQQGLNDLRAYVADLYAQEQGGKRFAAEEADLLGSEAQNRAANIAGQVVQVAALLNIEIQE